MIGPQVSCTMAHPKDWACPICDKTNPAQDVSDQCLGSAFRELACSGPLNFLLGIETVIQRARELQQAQVVGADFHTRFQRAANVMCATYRREVGKELLLSVAELLAYDALKAVDALTTPQSSAPVVGYAGSGEPLDLPWIAAALGWIAKDDGYTRVTQRLADAQKVAIESALTGRG